MIFTKDIDSAALALKVSSKMYFDIDFTIEQIKSHLSDKEYYAVFDNKLIGAAYYNGIDFHIGMIDKGFGASVIKKLTKNRLTRAVINNKDTRTIKLGTVLGFTRIGNDEKYTYMVKK